jgi:cell division septation protein DedD/nucleoid DNA-binding protein
MVLGKYIKLLLSEQKQVILPGFGNLEVKESPAAVSDAADMLSPPGLRIKFDSGFSKDDGLLAATYAEQDNVDEEEARQRVLELVDAIKFALDKGERYEIHGLGSFYRDSDGKVIFRKEKDWILDPGQYGLEPLDLLELDEAEKIETVPEPPVRIESDESFAVEPGNASLTNQREAGRIPQARAAVRHEPHREPRQGRWRAIWFVAGALIIVLIALILIPTNNLNLPGRKTTPPPVITEPAPSQTTVPGDQDADEPSDFESLTPESLENEPTETIGEPEPAAASNKYFLIAGSFSHLRNASELQDQMRSRGMSAEVMITENRMYRVSVGAFPTIGEAERELARIKSLPGLESCWILTN